MMEFRVYFDNKLANRETLDMIESIVVTQDLETASEAQLTIPICADDNGSWTKDGLNPETPYKEVRVEVRVDDKTWVALIDGLVIGCDVNLSGDPGKSSFVMVVQDDSYFLNRNQTVFKSANPDVTVENIIRESFKKEENRREVAFELDTPTNPMVGVDYTQRGKVMAMLQEIAKRHRCLLYLLPSEGVGKNVVRLRQQPPDSQPKPHQMILLGQGRNVETFEVKENRDSLESVSSTSLSFGTKVARTIKSRLFVQDVLEDKPVNEPQAGSETEAQDQPQEVSKETSGKKLVDPPIKEDAPSLDDQEMVTDAEAWAKSYTHEASGAVLAQRFKAVLRHGDWVSVATGSQTASGTYLVKSVIHTLNRFTYVQEFQLKRPRVGPSVPNPLVLEGIV